MRQRVKVADYRFAASLISQKHSKVQLRLTNSGEMHPITHERQGKLSRPLAFGRG